MINFGFAIERSVQARLKSNKGSYLFSFYAKAVSYSIIPLAIAFLVRGLFHFHLAYGQDADESILAQAIFVFDRFAISVIQFTAINAGVSTDILKYGIKFKSKRQSWIRSNFILLTLITFVPLHVHAIYYDFSHLGFTTNFYATVTQIISFGLLVWLLTGIFTLIMLRVQHRITKRTLDKLDYFLFLFAVMAGGFALIGEGEIGSELLKSVAVILGAIALALRVTKIHARLSSIGE